MPAASPETTGPVIALVAGASATCRGGVGGDVTSGSGQAPHVRHAAVA